MFAQLGNVKFELLDSFTNFEETHSAQFAKHEVLQGRPRLQSMGNDLTELKFGLRLHWKLGNVDTAYNGLISAKETGQAVSLVFGSGRFVGWFVIERLNSRTTIMDEYGRTASRELDIELLEFVGDPNNPLPTPAIVSGSQNPLLAMLPESVQGTVSAVVENVQTAVKIYHTVEDEIGQIQNIIQAAKDVKNDPVACLNLIGDSLGVANSALNNLNELNELTEITSILGNLQGVANFAHYTQQSTNQLGSAVAEIRAGIESGGNGNIGDWLTNGANAIDNVSDSLANGATAVQTMTALLAVRGIG